MTTLKATQEEHDEELSLRETKRQWYVLQIIIYNFVIWREGENNYIL